MMEEWILQFAVAVAAAIDLAMIAVIAIGVIHTLWRVVGCIVHRRSLASQVREIWLQFASWILLALEFALAADLIETVIAPNWEEIQRLGAIAVIRIALGYFLGRDIAEMSESREQAPPSP